MRKVEFMEALTGREILAETFAGIAKGASRRVPLSVQRSSKHFTHEEAPRQKTGHGFDSKSKLVYQEAVAVSVGGHSWALSLGKAEYDRFLERDLIAIPFVVLPDSDANLAEEVARFIEESTPLGHSLMIASIGGGIGLSDASCFTQQMEALVQPAIEKFELQRPRFDNPVLIAERLFRDDEFRWNAALAPAVTRAIEKVLSTA